MDGLSFVGKKKEIGNSSYVLVPKQIAEMMQDCSYQFFIKKIEVCSNESNNNTRAE